MAGFRTFILMVTFNLYFGMTKYSNNFQSVCQYQDVWTQWSLFCSISGRVARVERGTVFGEGWGHERASRESEECPGREEKRGGGVV